MGIRYSKNCKDTNSLHFAMSVTGDTCIPRRQYSWQMFYNKCRPCLVHVGHILTVQMWASTVNFLYNIFCLWLQIIIISVSEEPNCIIFVWSNVYCWIILGQSFEFGYSTYTFTLCGENECHLIPSFFTSVLCQLGMHVVTYIVKRR